MGVAGKVPGLPGFHALQYQSSGSCPALCCLAKDGIGGDGAGQKVMKADIGEIVTAIHIARLGTGGELKEHGQ